MKITPIHILILIICATSPFRLIAQVNIQDSLALVDLYDSTAGTGWTNHSNWLTTAPLNKWYGITISSTRVTGINLNGNNLIGTIPPSIGNVTQLSDFELNHNNLTDTLPSSLINCTMLFTLDLSYNQLTGTIPIITGIGLQTVLLSYNQFTNVNPSAFEAAGMGASTVSLDHNQLTTFPNWVGGQYGGIHALEYLNLNNNSITQVPAGITFTNFPQLHWINLNNNQLSGTLPADLLTPAGHSFEFLYLQNNHLSGPLPLSLSQVASFVLAPYELSGNSFTYDGMEAMVTAFGTADVLSSPQSSITIHQKGNQLSVYAGGTLAKDSFFWYKNGIYEDLTIGDSTYTMTSAGQYWAVVKNTIVTELTLYSDTVNITSLVTQICPPVSNITLNADTTGAIFQWQLNSGTGFADISDNSNYSGSNTGTLQLNNIPSSYYGDQYRCVVDGRNGTIYVLAVTDTWIGGADNTWENPLNWSCGAVPDNNTDVVITGGTIILTTDATIRSLSISSTANFTVNAGSNLTIAH